jgi:hypothetical protein
MPDMRPFPVAERTTFLGRQSEVSALRAAINRALIGHGSIVMLRAVPSWAKPAFGSARDRQSILDAFCCRISKICALRAVVPQPAGSARRSLGRRADGRKNKTVPFFVLGLEFLERTSENRLRHVGLVDVFARLGQLLEQIRRQFAIKNYGRLAAILCAAERLRDFVCAHVQRPVEFGQEN